MVIVGDLVVGDCATFSIEETIATKPHIWLEITGGGQGGSARGIYYNFRPQERNCEPPRLYQEMPDG